MAVTNDPVLALADRTLDVFQPTLDAAIPGSEMFDPIRLDGLELRHDVVPGLALHPAVALWFERRFENGPTPPQLEGWPHIAAGRHTLIAAPTGSGKTLAGFLMCINRLYVAHAATEPISGTRVVYVSPLKALAVDIAENLERPLAEIATVAAELDLSAPELTIGVRTGDTPPRERQAMIRSPRTFVVTTPESFYLLVTAGKSREILRSVETVIVDEIHAMARDKRGSHLSITLERLEHVCRSAPAGSASRLRRNPSRRWPGCSSGPASMRMARSIAPSSTAVISERSISSSNSPTASSKPSPRTPRWIRSSTGSRHWWPNTTPRSCSSTPDGSPNAWPTSSASASATTWSPPITGASRRIVGIGSSAGYGRGS